MMQQNKELNIKATWSVAAAGILSRILGFSEKSYLTISSERI